MPMPALVFRALRETNPELDDRQAMQVWDQLVQTVPEAETMEPQQVAKIIGMMGQQKAKTGYEGTAMAARNPQNPQAAHMNQFDPMARDAALADYNKRYQASLPQRNVSNLVASRGGPDVVETGRKAWGDVDAHNMLQSLKQQEGKEAQATAGLNAATNVLGQFGKQETNKQEQQKTATGAIDLAAKQRANTPGNALANLTMLSAIQQYKVANDGKEPDQAVKDHLKSLTQAELINFATPKFIEAWKEISAGRTAEAGADIDQAVAGSMVKKPVAAPTAKTEPSNATFNFSPGTDLVAVRQLMAASKDTKPGDLAAFDKKYPDVQAKPTPGKPELTDEAKNRLKTSPISGGRQTLQPTPQTMAAATAEGASAAEAEKKAEQWNSYTGPKLAEARNLIKNIGSGKGTAAMAAWLPGQDRELMNVLQQANMSLPGVLPANIANELSASMKQGGFTGGLVASLENGQLMRAIDGFEAAHKRSMDTARKRNVNIDQGGPANRIATNEPVAPTTIPPANAKGWKLHTDKNGNKAYVSPDGKQFEEVQ